MKQNKLTGFTILEILVATVLISILVSSGIYFVNVSEKRTVVEDTAIQLSLLRNFPSAIVQTYQTKSSLKSVTLADLTKTGEVQTNEPVAWAIGAAADSIGPTDNGVTLVFTFTEQAQASRLHTFLQSRLAGNLISATALAGSDMKMLRVTYSL